MTRISSLILLSATALALSSPAFAKASIQTGEKLCKAEISKQAPAPKSVRVAKDETKANNAAFVFTLRVKQADNTSAKVFCSVDRESEAVSLAAAD